MRPGVPQDIGVRTAEWDNLHRWERSELGKSLRYLSLTYGETRELIPVPRRTLSYWCRDIRLSPDQIEATKRRSKPGSRIGIPANTPWRGRREIETIRTDARVFGEQYMDDAFFIAGVALYWGEGSKTRSDLSQANADPRALRLFIDWVRIYHDSSAEFVLKINPHADNDEPAARPYWAEATSLPSGDFHRTFTKPDGTGHRKNHLPHGVCQIRVRRCADHWYHTMAWVDALASGGWYIGKSDH
jgi:hypothetical protein